MRNALQDKKVWGIVEKETKIPTDPKEKDVHDALEIKAQRLLLDGVKDCFIHHIGEKNRAHEMWTILKSMFEAKHERRIVALKERIQHTRMTKGEGVATYLTKVKKMIDEHNNGS